MRKQKKEREPGARRAHIFQVLLWSLLIAGQIFWLHCMKPRAEEPVKQIVQAQPALQLEAAEAAAEVEVTSQLYESRQACVVPPETYTGENGQIYERKRWEAVPVWLPAQRQTVEEKRIFERAEGMAALPETIELRMKEPEDGRSAVGVCRAESVEILREWWSPDFSFPVQFHSYDADYYQIGGKMIPFDEERPRLEGCEELLFNMIGVSAEEYRITDIRWDGEEYLDEAGILCRDAVASGEKLLRDYQVLYRGVAEFPAAERWRTVTVYGLPNEPVPEAEDRRNEEAAAEQETIAASDAEDTERQAAEPSFWKRVFKVVKVILSLLLPLLLILLVVLVKWRRSWYNKQKENNRDRRKNA